MTIEEAMKRIEELEAENSALKEELKSYEGRAFSGRKKHDAKWQASYDAFVNLYEQGLSMVEIVERSDCSRRTCYRYKEYYDSLKKEK